MKVKFFFNLVLSGAMMLGIMTACGKIEMQEEAKSDRIAVQLNIDVVPVTTLRSDDRWGPGDRVGLFMKRAGQALTAGGAIYGEADNLSMRVEGELLVSDHTIYYPEDGNNVDFVAYYPHSSVGSGCTLAMNLTVQNETSPSDLLYSDNAGGITPSTTPVELNFVYALAKIKVTVTGSENLALTSSDFAGMTMNMVGLYRQASWRLADGSFSDFTDRSPISPYRTGNTAVSTTFEALVFPVAESGTITFVFNVGGDDYYCNVPNNFAGGMCYEYDIKLESSPIVVLLKAAVTPRTVTSDSFTARQMQDESQIKITPDAKTVDFQEADITVNVTASNPWTVVIPDNAGWVSVKSQTATQAILAVEKNESFEQRSALIIFRSNGEQVIFNLTQEMLPIIYIPKNTWQEYNLPGDAVNPNGNSQAYRINTMWNENYTTAWLGYYSNYGYGIPQQITWDLGVTAVLCRFKIWHMITGSTTVYYEYNVSSPRNFELWGSTNPNPDGSWDESWIPLGQFTTLPPSSNLQPTLADRTYMRENGHECVFEASAFAPNPFTPVRYIRLKTLTTFLTGISNDDRVTIKQIDFWGRIID